MRIIARHAPTTLARLLLRSQAHERNGRIIARHAPTTLARLLLRSQAHERNV
jgi:hypothetical protein